MALLLLPSQPPLALGRPRIAERRLLGRSEVAEGHFLAATPHLRVVGFDNQKKNVSMFVCVGAGKTVPCVQVVALVAISMLLYLSHRTWGVPDWDELVAFAAVITA